MNEQRDTRLGALLSEIEIEEHGEGYWDEVRRGVEPELAPLRRPLWKRRGARVGYLAAAAAAVIAIVLLAGLPNGGGRLLVQPADAAAAIRATLAALDDAQGLAGTVRVGRLMRGRFVEQYVVDFLCARDGSMRREVRGVAKRGYYSGGFSLSYGTVQTTAYDSRARRAESLLDQSYSVKSATTRTRTLGNATTTSGTAPYMWMQGADLAPGPPDLNVFPLGPEPSLWQMRAYLRTVLGDPHVHFATTRLDGRPVWVLTVPLERETAFPEGTSPRLRIVVDAYTRLPLRWTVWWGNGQPPEESIVSAATLAQPPARSEFSLQRPPAKQTLVEEDTFADGNGIVEPYFLLPMGNVNGMNAYANGMAAFPTWLPAGFRLQAAAATSPDGGGVPWPKRRGGGQLVPTITISSSYRRGFDQVAISVRVDPRLAGPTVTEGSGGKSTRVDISDPFLQNGIDAATRAYWARHTIDIRLHGGAYSGSMAHIVIDPDHVPHLWVRKEPYLATVAGDLTAAEMVRVAESLSPWRAGMRLP